MVRKSLLIKRENASEHFFNIAFISKTAELRIPFELYVKDGITYRRVYEAGQLMVPADRVGTTKYSAREKYRLVWAACLLNACEDSDIDIHTLIGCGQVISEAWVRHLYNPFCRKLASRWIQRLLEKRSDTCFLDSYAHNQSIFEGRRHLRLTYLAARILRRLPLAETTQRQLMLGCYCLDLGANGLSLRGSEARRATIAILSFERPISSVLYDAVLSAPMVNEVPSPVSPSKAWISEFMAALLHFDRYLQGWLIDNHLTGGLECTQETIWRSFRKSHHNLLTVPMLKALESEILNVNRPVL